MLICLAQRVHCFFRVSWSQQRSVKHVHSVLNQDWHLPLSNATLLTAAVLVLLLDLEVWTTPTQFLTGCGRLVE